MEEKQTLLDITPSITNNIDVTSSITNIIDVAPPITNNIDVTPSITNNIDVTPSLAEENIETILIRSSSDSIIIEDSNSNSSSDSIIIEDSSSNSNSNNSSNSNSNNSSNSNSNNSSDSNSNNSSDSSLDETPIKSISDQIEELLKELPKNINEYNKDFDLVKRQISCVNPLNLSFKIVLIRDTEIYKDGKTGNFAGAIAFEENTNVYLWIKLIDVEIKEYNIFYISSDDIKNVANDIITIRNTVEGYIPHKYVPKKEHIIKPKSTN